MNFKKFLPSESYVLTTKLSVAEVKNLISENINQQKKFSLNDFNNPLTRQYQGQILNDTFTINQVVVGRRNSFAPLIIGHITSYSDTTIIKVEMKLRPFTINFMISWLSFVGLCCLGTIIAGILQIHQILHKGFSPFALIPFAMFVFGCFLPSFGFNNESTNSKYYLANLINGQEQQSN